MCGQFSAIIALAIRVKEVVVVVGRTYPGGICEMYAQTHCPSKYFRDPFDQPKQGQLVHKPQTTYINPPPTPKEKVSKKELAAIVSEWHQPDTF